MSNAAEFQQGHTPHTPVDCPTCGARVDIGGPLEDRHFVFALRPNGTRSNLGRCPNGDGGMREAIRKSMADLSGRASFRGEEVTPGPQQGADTYRASPEDTVHKIDRVLGYVRD